MNRTISPWYDTMHGCVLLRQAVSFLVLLTLGTGAALAQKDAPTMSPNGIRVTHLLGFEGTSKNANGTLSLNGDALQFEKPGKPAVELKMSSVQDVFLGEQSKEIGGLPMTLGKTAAPFGGGRVVSLFAHKNYDTLTLEYVDANGGFHGAIFQLDKGQGDVLRNELIARGVHVNHSDEELTKQGTAEAPSASQ